MPPKTTPEVSQRRRDVIEAEIRSLPEKLLPEKKAAHIYNMSVHWFRRKRKVGGGPRVTKIGRSVRYHIDDLEKYFSSPPS